jgi:hypothetical protein
MSNNEGDVDESMITEEMEESTKKQHEYKKKQMKEWKEKDVQDFLKDNNFDETKVKELKNYDGTSFLKLIDSLLCKQLFGEFENFRLKGLIDDIIKKVFFIYKV